jgi:hypothetical protein
LGLKFERDPGRAWRPVLGHKDTYYPDKRTKEGKGIDKRLKAIKIPGSAEFSELIGGGYFIVSGRNWASISFETIGDAYVVSMPIGDPEACKDAEFIPPDATILKYSEYYAMKEAAEQS